MGSERMAKYIVKRVIMALITILVVACVTFVLMMSVPGSPFNDEKIMPEQKAAMEAKYGMDDPLSSDAALPQGSHRGPGLRCLPEDAEGPSGAGHHHGEVPLRKDRRHRPGMGRGGGHTIGLSGGLQPGKMGGQRLTGGVYPGCVHARLRGGHLPADAFLQ